MTAVRCGFVALSLALASCGRGESKCDDGADNDNDGWADCADQDCAATCGEVCDNLIDDNGDGNIDCIDPLCEGSCGDGPVDEDCRNGVDDDHDRLVDCGDDDCDLLCDGDADGWIDEAYGGLDCDDAEHDVNPEATEVSYNSHDDDCDPTTPDDDLDGDGFLLADDCDGSADADPLTYPGAVEVCGDGVVNDCESGLIPPREYCYGDREAETADAIILGPSASGYVGYGMALVGDTNDDGYADLVSGAFGDGGVGGAYLVEGPVAGDFDLSVASRKWLGETVDSYAGFSVAGGNDLVAPGVGLDGKVDVILGAPNDDTNGNDAGAVYVVPTFGPSQQTELIDVDRRLLGEAEYDGAGAAVGSPGDVDGDGLADVLVGSPYNSRTRAGAGAVHVVPGPITGPTELSSVGYRIGGDQAGDYLGCAVSGAGDLDGDGQQDILVGACADGTNGQDAGAAGQFSTHVSSDRELSDADAILRGDSARARLGSALAGGDIDGDGLSDALIGAPGADTDSGAVYLVRGPALAGMASPWAVLTGDAGDEAGTSVSWAGDVDGDGENDVIVGAPGNDLGGEDAGAAYVVFGPFAGERSLADADVRIIGSAPYDRLGQSVSAGQDVDDDGFPDLIVGAPYHDGLNPAAGAIYLFTFALPVGAP
jgi:FG-GAP repeat